MTDTPAPTGQPRPNANPYCSRCGDNRGGPYGHETNECTWNRPPDEEQRTVEDMPEGLRRLIGGVLWCVERDDIERCAKLILRLNIEYPPGGEWNGVVLAMLAAVDWWAATAGLTDDGDRPNVLGIVNPDAGPDEVMIGPVDTLPPKQRWAAQFAMARLRRDHDMTEALLSALPNSREQGSYVLNLLGMAGENVRKIREGFNPLPMRPR